MLAVLLSNSTAAKKRVAWLVEFTLVSGESTNRHYRDTGSWLRAELCRTARRLITAVFVVRYCANYESGGFSST